MNMCIESSINLKWFDFTLVSAGSSSCTCIGKNRAFQHSDGSCLCRTGFIFYNELDFKSSTSDSELDCQPEVSWMFLPSINLFIYQAAELSNNEWIWSYPLSLHFNFKLSQCTFDSYTKYIHIHKKCLSSVFTEMQLEILIDWKSHVEVCQRPVNNWSELFSQSPRLND